MSFQTVSQTIYASLMFISEYLALGSEEVVSENVLMSSVYSQKLFPNHITLWEPFQNEGFCGQINAEHTTYSFRLLLYS